MLSHRFHKAMQQIRKMASDDLCCHCNSRENQRGFCKDVQCSVGLLVCDMSPLRWLQSLIVYFDYDKL